MVGAVVMASAVMPSWGVRDDQPPLGGLLADVEGCPPARSERQGARGLKFELSTSNLKLRCEHNEKLGCVEDKQHCHNRLGALSLCMGSPDAA
jgi:hypothetical protein